MLRDFCDGKLVSFCLPPRAATVPGVSAPLPGASGRRVPAADAPPEAASQDRETSTAADNAGLEDHAAASGAAAPAAEPAAERSTDAAAAASPAEEATQQVQPSCLRCPHMVIKQCILSNHTC